MAEPIYLTQQDYLDFSGINLSLELQGSNYDNPSDMVDIFLKRVEDWCLDYLFMKFGVSTTYPKGEDKLPIFDAVAFKKGLLHQIDYLRRNGDLSIQAVNQAPELAPNALMVWKNAGMCNVAHKNYEGVVGYWV
jgi:hypothetical protein